MENKDKIKASHDEACRKMNDGARELSQSESPEKEASGSQPESGGKIPLPRMLGKDHLMKPKPVKITPIKKDEKDGK